MKSCFTAVILSLVSTLSFAADAAPQSVLQQPTLAASEVAVAPAIEQAPAPAIAATSACTDCACNGTCAVVRGGRQRFRVVTEECDACTGTSVRSVTRGVVRGGAAVVQSAGAAAVNVVTLPARVVRRARCSGACCCR
jgi:hypothetical protein